MGIWSITFRTHSVHYFERLLEICVFFYFVVENMVDSSFHLVRTEHTSTTLQCFFFISKMLEIIVVKSWNFAFVHNLFSWIEFTSLRNVSIKGSKNVPSRHFIVGGFYGYMKIENIFTVTGLLKK